LFADLLSMTESQDQPAGLYWRERLLRAPAAVLRRTGMGAWSWAGEVLGHTADHRQWLAAVEARARLRLTAKAAFETCNVILAPCVGVAPFAHQPGGRALRSSDGRSIPYAALAHWSALASVCGLPATIVPAGFTHSGLPVGVQIIGPRGSDSRTLAVAQALDETIAGFTAPTRPQDL
ncbi:MAG: Amidase, partial [Caulobacter sp.]|nr:Amidase [Caulobacter sp.]